jgi:hypothetical protein
MRTHEPQESYTYVVYAQEPSPPILDLEDAHKRALEVTVTWQHNTLFHAELAADRDFFLGASPQPKRRWRKGHAAAAHFMLPSELLGAPTLRLIGQTAHGPAVLLGELPNEATFTYDSVTHDHANFVALCVERGWFDAERSSAHWPLQGGPLRITVGLFHIDCGEVSAAKAVPRALFSSASGESMAYFGLSFASAAALMASAAFFTPSMGLTASDAIDRNDLILMQQYLDAAAERERLEQEHAGESEQAESTGESGKRASDEEGAMGDTKSPQTNRRYAVKGTPDNADPHLARERAMAEATTFGAVGLLQSITSDPNAPTAPWGRDTSLGLDAQSAMGGMWGEDIGNSFGGGLGLTGAGDGGGHHGESIGVGDVGTLNRGMGPGGNYGFGNGHGRVPGTHSTRGFKMRTPNVQVSGRLPPQIIQRIVRQNHGRFRLCYERGLGANPSLNGRVNVRFVIGRNGAVSNVSNAGSTLPNGEVVNCVVRAFYGLSFPKPEGGLVTVSYPIAFSPE